MMQRMWAWAPLLSSSGSLGLNIFSAVETMARESILCIYIYMYIYNHIYIHIYLIDLPLDPFVASKKVCYYPIL
jgi:hypothetical protein